MPGIIFRYTAKNLLQFFFGILFVFVFVIFMGQFSRIFTYATDYGANMFWVISMMGYLLPDILVLSIPMAFQIAILMTLTSMSQSGEIMALRAAGFSFKEISKPIFITAALLSMIMIYLNGWFSPVCRHEVEESKKDIASRITKVNIEPRTFIDLGDWDIFVEGADKKGTVLEQVYLTRKKDNTALSTKVNAATGKLEFEKDGLILNLENGQMQRVDSLDSRKIITAEFESYDLYIPLSQKSGKKRDIKPAEMTTPQLIENIKAGTLTPKELKGSRPEPMNRLVMALSPIIFFFLSCPVAFVTDKKAGRAGAMIFSIVFIFSYFGLLTVGKNIAEKFTVAFIMYGGPAIALIAGAVCGYILWRKKLSN